MPRRGWFAVAFAVVGAIAGIIFALRSDPLDPVREPSERAPDPPTPSIPAGQPYPYGRVVVVAVGINRYPNVTGEPAALRGAVRDAEGVVNLARSHLGYEARELLDGQATKRSIELAVKTAADELGPEDALIFYFAGHGQVIEIPKAGEAGFLVPHDASLDLKFTSRYEQWEQQAINVHDLFTRASGSQARHVLFILDACKSGIATGRGALGERCDLRTFLFQKSRAVLASSRRDQIARENTATGHGEFTKVLLEHLGKNEPLSALDLYQLALRDVANRTNGAMLPQLGQIEGDGMVVFIPKVVPRADIERDLRDVPRGALAGVQTRAAALMTQQTTMAEVLDAFRTNDYRGAPDADDRTKTWEGNVERLRRNAGSGDVQAMAALHFCYSKGLGVDHDLKLAYEWAKQADRFTRPPGLGRWVLGLCRQNGTGADGGNPSAAEELFRASAAAGFSPGKLALARVLLSKREPDLEQVRRLLTEAHQDGLPDAGSDLADLLLAEKAPGELSKWAVLMRRLAAVPAAEKLYRAAAELGLARGELGLFLIYADGRPGYPRRDATRAEEHLRRAAAAGLPEALYHLGRAHEGDENRRPLLELKPDAVLARNCFERAGRLNYAPGLHHSARMLLEGRGGAKDEKLARERIEAAIRLDYPPAYTFKANRLAKGNELPTEGDEEFNLIELAAKRGDPEACLLLGYIYWSGVGPERKLSLGGQLYHSHTHVGAHWLMKALVLDDQKRFLKVQSLARALLQKMLRGPGDEIQQRLSELDGRPDSSEVLRLWKTEHPETFRMFCERFGARVDLKSSPDR